MNMLKIGYWPLSNNLKAAGDRRRLVFWANARGHQVITDQNQNIDVIVASENSDFNSGYFSNRKVPVILDLVDAYLSPLNQLDDFARGMAKKFSGQIGGSIKPFSHHIRDFCMDADAVICSSVEQKEVIEIYCDNAHVILDSHDEIPFLNPQAARMKIAPKRQIFWEGQPATIRGVKNISKALSELTKTNELHFNFVTDERYFQFMNKFFVRDTLELLKRDLANISDLISVIPWTPDNLVDIAKQSHIAMIPIDLSIPMQRLKPENRLLIMWRLGLPCLTSPSPAYSRVAHEAGVDSCCNNTEEWVENFNRLLSDPEFSYSEITKGQNYLRENHNRNLLLDKWDKVFESVVG